MRIVEEPVQGRVAEGRISDEVVPVLDGDLAGEDGAAPGITVIEDFEEIVAAGVENGLGERFGASGSRRSPAR